MKNDLIFFLVLQKFGTPQTIYLNFDEIKFNPQKIEDSLVGIPIEHIALDYKIKGISLSIRISDYAFVYTISSEASNNIKTQIKILKTLKNIKFLLEFQKNITQQTLQSAL